MDESTRRVRMGQVFTVITNAFAEGLEVQYEKLVAETMFKFGSSRRTSIEYINASLSQIQHEVVKEEGIKWIRPLEKEKSIVREA